mmetsp:Transcript_18734/g.25344  ORF Transcript_18734/g.25344 Transcript_18734/m.25344 type:complete len:206 (+) Transcript_18734:563-1180(+)
MPLMTSLAEVEAAVEEETEVTKVIPTVVAVHAVVVVETAFRTASILKMRMNASRSRATVAVEVAEVVAVVATSRKRRVKASEDVTTVANSSTRSVGRRTPTTETLTDFLRTRTISRFFLRRPSPIKAPSIWAVARTTRDRARKPSRILELRANTSTGTAIVRFALKRRSHSFARGTATRKTRSKLSTTSRTSLTSSRTCLSSVSS